MYNNNENNREEVSNKLWNHIKEYHLKILREDKEKLLEKKKDELVYKDDVTGEGKKSGDKISEEAFCVVDTYLDSFSEEVENEKKSKSFEKQKINAEKLISKEAIKKLEELLKEINDLKKLEEIEVLNLKGDDIDLVSKYLRGNREGEAEVNKIKNSISIANFKNDTNETVEIKKAPNIPNILVKKTDPEEEIYDDYNSWKNEADAKNITNYYKNIIYPTDDYGTKEEIKKTPKTKSDQLPEKLYSISEKKIVKARGKIDKSIYATLSYVCRDDMVPHEEWKLTSEEGKKKTFKLSPSSTKSLSKAIIACRILDMDINYLWMDKLCINQSDPEEKAEGVRKMYENYNNSAVTLIAIHKNVREKSSGQNEWDRDSLKVLEKIVNSEWFSRSWTFQEGWLSKRTIFMFDDMLIDGAFLAQVWAYNQSADAEGKYDSHKDFEEKSKKIATPIGWVRHTVDKKDRVTFHLHEALRGIKDRERGVSIDGIYTVLGLLPYGEDVVVEYGDWDHEYTTEELQKALMEVMKTAAKYENKNSGKGGCGEFLAWYGLTDEKGSESWLPKIHENGSVEVWGGIDIDLCGSESMSIDVNNGTIKFSAKKYYIDGSIKDMTIIGGKTILKGTYSGKIALGNNLGDIKVWGTRETLEKVATASHLIIPDESKIKSETPFAIVVEGKENGYHRVGLVELKKEEREKLLVNCINKQVKIEVHLGEEYKKTSQKMLESSNEKHKLDELVSEIREKEIEIKSLKKQLNKSQSRTKFHARKAELLSKINEVKTLEELEKQLAQIQIDPK